MTAEQTFLVEEAFTHDWRGFKQLAAEFIATIKKNPTPAQIEGGLKAINLAFIYMKGTELDRYQSEILLSIVHREAEKYLVGA
jgi:hypothetical protein